MSAQLALIICLFSPFVAAGLNLLLSQRPAIRDAANLSLPFLALLAAALLLAQGGDITTATLHTGAFVGGVPIAFNIEPMGAVFAGLILLLWPVAMLYSLAYLTKTASPHQSRFLFFYNISVGSAIAIAFSANLLTLFIFYELLTLCTYPLVTHNKSAEAKAAGRFYLAVLLGTSTVFFLLAVIFIWYFAGHLDFVKGGILQSVIDPSWATGLLLLFVAGVAKAAVMPFHQWLPKAMVAPAPVSALLHAVAVVKAGVFTIAKTVVYIFGTGFLTLANTQWLIYLACITIVLASLIALRQCNIKKLLAYSTVSQLSYVVLGIALLKPLALTGAILHIVAHGFAKITLFFAAGALQTQSKITRTDQLYGIGKYMPWTMGAFTVAALSIIGLPPLVGFTSKWFLLSEATLAEQYIAVAAIVISTLLNAMYFLPMIYRAFWSSQETPELNDASEAPPAMLIAMLWPAAMCLICFFYIDELMQFFAGAL